MQQVIIRPVVGACDAVGAIEHQTAQGSETVIHSERVYTVSTKEGHAVFTNRKHYEDFCTLSGIPVQPVLEGKPAAGEHMDRRAVERAEVA
jgi:hypothetical protein